MWAWRGVGVEGWPDLQSVLAKAALRLQQLLELKGAQATATAPATATATATALATAVATALAVAVATALAVAGAGVDERAPRHCMSRAVKTVAAL